MKTKDFFKGTLKPENGVVLLTMAGGSGTRFWPLSRSSRPKQFLPLSKDGLTLIESSISRFEPLVGKNASLVVTAEAQAELVSKAVPKSAILMEPSAKNTAACLALSAYYVLETIGDIPMICTPADHLIDGEEDLRAVFKKASELAKKEDILITIGIKPTSPETGYGYIRRGLPFKDSSEKPSGAFSVAQFVEKPDSITASNYVESGEFYWNSGMFVWRPSVLLNALEALLPDTAQKTKNCISMIIKGEGTEKELRALYNDLESISIDFGVMEKAKNVVVFPAHNFTWSDVGSWSSWYETSLEDSADGFQNVVRGNVVLVSSRGCAVLSSDELGFSSSNDKKKKLIAAVGLTDVIIVETDDCLLVCNRNEAQKVRNVVDILKKKKETDFI